MEVEIVEIEKNKNLIFYLLKSNMIINIILKFVYNKVDSDI